MNQGGKVQRAWDSNTRFTLAETAEILRSEMTVFDDLEDRTPDVVKVILLVGLHGVAKTSLVRQVAEMLGHEHWKWEIGATVFEDNVGTQREVDDVEIGDETFHFNEHRRAMHVPGLRPAKSDSGYGVIFHDEVRTGSVDHQNQQRSIFSWMINEIPIHPSWRWQIAATNPETAEYLTVKGMDAALESRFIAIPIQGDESEYLAYWQAHDLLPDELYGFLLMNQDLIGTDSRSWTNFGHSLKHWLRTGISRDLMTKMVSANMDVTVAARFNKYLVSGNNPDEYPILSKHVLEADSQQLTAIVERVKRWVAWKNTQGAEEPRTALLGATSNDVAMRVLDFVPSTADELKRVAKNLSAVCESICTGPFVEMADHIIMSTKSGPLCKELFNNFKNTAVHSRMKNQLDKFHARQQEMDNKRNPAEAVAG